MTVLKNFVLYRFVIFPPLFPNQYLKVQENLAGVVKHFRSWHNFLYPRVQLDQLVSFFLIMNPVRFRFIKIFIGFIGKPSVIAKIAP